LVWYDLHDIAAALAPRARDAAPGALEARSEAAKSVDELVAEAVSLVLGRQAAAAFDASRPLMEMGLDSLQLLELRSILEARLGVNLEPTFFFDYATPQAISRFLEEPPAEASATPDRVTDSGHPAKQDQPVVQAVPAARTSAAEDDDAVAIV